MIFLAMKLRKFPWVTQKKPKKLTGHGSHLFSICAGHLEPEEIPLLGVWRVNEITFSCTLEKSQEHLSDQTSPFVLFLQVFLIKNVISLINCLNAPTAGPIVFLVLCTLWFSQGTESERKMGFPPPNSVCMNCFSFTLCIGVRTWLLSETSKCSIFPAFGCPQTRPVRFAFLIQILDGGSLLLVIAGWKVALLKIIS